MTSRQATICFGYFVVWILICHLTYFVDGFPSQCKDDKFFDHLNKMYLPCSECNKKQLGCTVCCSTSKPDVMEASMSSRTEPLLSLEDKSNQEKYHILNVFLQSFVIAMVACTLLVLAYVAHKVSRERQAAECLQGNHFQNADANIVQEVFTVGPSPTAVQDGIDESATVRNPQRNSKKDPSQAVNITVNKLPGAGVSGVGVKDFSWDRKL